jgi:hypothetical protein
LDDIRGLKPFILFSPNWKLLLLVGGVLFVLAVLLNRLLRSREIEGTLEGPAFSAAGDALASVRQQLDELRDSGLMETGSSLEFHGRLSALMRAFLGKHFALPGRRLTTTELLVALEPLPLEAALYDLLQDFLTQCDLVKFAKAKGSPEEMLSRLAFAFFVIDALGDAVLPLEEADAVG